MRINLNFKDSTIRKLSASEFEILFDLSDMIKPRLSPDARMYIEYFTICEFLDEALGTIEGDLKGFFELRCPNLPSLDYDTSMGNNGGTVLFSGPLENYRTYTNSNPMFLSNFKIDQGFLSNRLIMILSVFDRFGDPYDSSKHLKQSVDINSSEYKAYLVEMKAFNNLNDELEASKQKLNYAKMSNQSYESFKNYYRSQFEDTSTVLKKELQDWADETSKSLRSRVIAEQLLIFFATESLASYKAFFEDTYKDKRSNPYADPGIKSALDKFYTAFQKYHEYDSLFDHSTKLVQALETSSQPVITNFIPQFNPDSINIKDARKIVEYTDSSGAKTGQIEIDYFNSVKESIIGVEIHDIKQAATTGTSADLLVNGDTIIIKQDNSGDDYFETSLLSTFKYYISHTDPFNPGASTGVGFAVNHARNQQFALEVTRNASAYTYKFLENEPNLVHNVPTRNFSVGDLLTIKGRFLGGVDPTNDLVIEILEIDPQLPDEDIKITNYRPFSGVRDFGLMDLEVTKPNNHTTKTDEAYVIKSQDLSRTKSFMKKEKFVIDGTLLNGITSTNNLIVTVDDIFEDVDYAIDVSIATHSIDSMVDEGQSVIKDATGKQLSGSTKPTFQASITSENGIYDITIISSKNFAANSTVFIKGEHLTGETTTNDLEFTFTGVSSSGEIDNTTITLTVNCKPARQLQLSDGTSGFELAIKQTLQKDVYTIHGIDIANAKENDTITIAGDELGGDADVNKLVLTYQKDANGSLEWTLTGTALQLNNQYGQIKAFSVSGNGRYIPVQGKIIRSDFDATSKQPIDISTITMPQLEITITDDLYRSVNTILPEVNAQEKVVETSKDSVVSTTAPLISHLGKRQAEKLKCMHMSLVLYDEMPTYEQSSQDAIKGNTYSQLNTPQFKRI